MKTLNKVKSKGRNGGIISEVLEYNGFKFKLKADIHNGGSYLKAELMDKEGIFQFVLGYSDVDFEWSASYVSSEEVLMRDLEAGLREIKKVIKNIY